MAMSPINVFLGSCWSNEYCVGFFSGAGEEKMDPDKSVVFAYDGGASSPSFGHFRPTYTAYAFPLDIVLTGFKLSESDTKSRHLESGNL